MRHKSYICSVNDIWLYLRRHYLFQTYISEFFNLLTSNLLLAQVKPIEGQEVNLKFRGCMAVLLPCPDFRESSVQMYHSSQLHVRNGGKRELILLVRGELHSFSATWADAVAFWEVFWDILRRSFCHFVSLWVFLCQSNFAFL